MELELNGEDSFKIGQKDDFFKDILIGEMISDGGQNTENEHQNGDQGKPEPQTELCRAEDIYVNSCPNKDMLIRLLSTR